MRQRSRPTAVVCVCRWTYESLSQEIAYFFVVLFNASFVFQCVFLLAHTSNCLFFVERKRIWYPSRWVSATPEHAYSDSPFVGDLCRCFDVFQVLGFGQFHVTAEASARRFYSCNIRVKRALRSSSSSSLWTW